MKCESRSALDCIEEVAYQVSPFTREKSWLKWDPLVSIFPVSRKRAGNLALELTSTTSTIATFNWSSMWSRLVPGQKKADPAGHDLRQQHARTRAALGQLPSGEVRRAQETSRCAIPCPFPSSPPPSRLPLPLPTRFTPYIWLWYKRSLMAGITLGACMDWHQILVNTFVVSKIFNHD